jgi:phosphoenolpyruvate phosphomutase
VEDRIATVNEIFRLQDADEYSAAEKIYLTGGQAPGSAVVLAAGRGKGLEALTEDKPKVMLPVAGKPLLRWLVDGFKNQGINDITVVGGYKAEAIDAAGIKLVRNERHAETGELASLACAADSLQTDTVIAYGDLLFRSYILRDLLETDAPFSVVVDSSESAPSNQSVRDFAWCSAADDRDLFGQKVLLRKISTRRPAGDAPHGRWIGLLNVRGEGRARLQKLLANCASARLRHARHARPAQRAGRRRREGRGAVRARPLARRERPGRLPSRGRLRAHADAVRAGNNDGGAR